MLAAFVPGYFPLLQLVILLFLNLAWSLVWFCWPSFPVLSFFSILLPFPCLAPSSFILITCPFLSCLRLSAPPSLSPYSPVTWFCLLDWICFKDAMDVHANTGVDIILSHYTSLESSDRVQVRKHHASDLLYASWRYLETSVSLLHVDFFSTANYFGKRKWSVNRKNYALMSSLGDTHIPTLNLLFFFEVELR